MPGRARLSVPGVLLFATATALGAESAPTVDVKISGIEDPLLTNVQRFLSINEFEEEGLVSRLTSGDDEEAEATAAEVQRRHRAAGGQIRDALMPYGYYLPDVQAELEKTSDGYTARYHIDPGEPARLRTVNVQVLGEGRSFPAIEQALNGIELAAEQHLVHERYENAKSSLFDAAYNNGFLDAAWQANQIRVAPDRLHADIDLVLETGPRFFFGATTVRQNVLDPGLMSGFVKIPEGDPYDVERLLDLQRVLNETDYFSRVEIRAPREAAGADNHVPVTVLTEPARSQKYSLGLGFGTDTGPRIKLGVLLRRINARGHRLRADLQLSAIEQVIGARYEIPIRNYATDSLSFSATARKAEIGDADTDQVSLGVSHLVSWLGFRRRLYVQAEREQFQFGDGPTEETDLVYPGITLTRERADDLQYPRRGYSLRADLRSGAESLLSDVSFSRLELSSRWTRGIAPRTRVLLRAEAGVLWTSEFAALPPSQRFFAGGDRSIRGYAFRDVGPRNEDGDVIGGKRLLSGSIELEQLFYGNYGAAVFVDAGDAFDDSPDIKLGAGVGLRWRSPIGIVRFDVAHPFDDPDDNYRIHLTIGAEL
jgi:translocation and assembly module TamA